jgi:hypothetical protein
MQSNKEADMPENTATDTIHDDDLGDEALDRTDVGKAVCGTVWCS